MHWYVVSIVWCWKPADEQPLTERCLGPKRLVVCSRNRKGVLESDNALEEKKRKSHLLLKTLVAVVMVSSIESR